MGKTLKSENLILKAALEYHLRGWSIIPIKAGTKKPAVKWEQYQKERPDENQLQEWFASGKNNIAVIVGEVSGGLACRGICRKTPHRGTAGKPAG